MKTENKIIIGLICFCILLITIGGFVINKSITLKKDFKNYERTISALNDSIHKTIEKGFTSYSQKVPEIDIEELINSEYFKTMDKEKQKMYKELSKIKGLIAASNINLVKQGELIDRLKNNPGVIEQDSIKFKLGTELTFNEKDSTKKLQWNSKIILNKNIDFNFKYKYNVDILTTFERQKDKSIIVKYKINDPDLNVTEMNNFIIPIEPPKNGFVKFYLKNKKPINIIGGALLFTGGGFVGYKLAK